MEAKGRRVLALTHEGLDGGDVWLREAGGGRALGGVNSWVGGDGGGAASTVGVLDVPSAVAASAATFP